MKLKFSPLTFGKYANTIFHENLSSGSRVLPYVHRTDGLTDITKIIITFRNFLNALKMAVSWSIIK